MNDGSDRAPSVTATVTHSARDRSLFGRIDLVMLACILMGISVRLYAFGSVPRGLHQDEASAAYDAFALLHYGIDRHGFHNPVAFVAWGSGMFALVSYAAMPFIAVLGLTTLAVRLPCLLAGIAGLLLFPKLVSETNDRRTARVAALLLAICPWHIQISRWALDSNLLPAVLLAAVTAGVVALRRPWFLVLSGALFGLSFYAYGTAYVTVPILLALAVPYALWHRCYPRIPLLAAFVVGGIVALPALLYVAVNTLGWNSIITPWFSIPRLPGVPRYETVGNFHIWEPNFYSKLAGNYGEAARILVLQRDETMHNAVPGFGLVYLFSVPLAVWGFVLLCRRCWQREFTASYFMLAWCVTGMLLPVVIVPNINRLNVAWIPLVYCTTRGVSWFFERWRGVVWAILCVYTLSFAAFVWTYFGSYAEKSAPWFFPHLPEAIAAASAETSGRICITHGINMPYIYALFATREDPREFLRTVKYKNAGEEFEEVSSYGRYQFGLPEKGDPTFEAYVVFDAIDYPAEAFDAQKFGDFLVLRKKH